MAILDADKEGFLRAAWSLIQVIRPSRAQRRRRRSSCTPTRSPSRCRSRSTRRTGGAPVQERLQRRARHRAADDHQGDPRHQRPPARGGRGARRVHRRRATASSRELPQGRRSRSSWASSRREMRAAAAQARVRARRGAARRDPADPPARPRGGRFGGRARAAAEAAARVQPRRRRRVPAVPAVGAERRGSRQGASCERREADAATVRGDVRGGPGRRRGAGRAPRGHWSPRRPTRARPPTGCPASATSTRTTAAGWRAGSTVRHGTGGSRPTSSSAPAPGAAAADLSGERRDARNRTLVRPRTRR